ncbi:MAG: hypothetical protein ACREGB_01540 [Candidatus Saccharimonadales bacterium]
MPGIYSDEFPEEALLPPPDVWLVDPRKDKFETPVDDRGFVDVPNLIQAVKDTIDSGYEWPSDANIHHFYWKEEWYHSRLIGANALRFRELPIHKALLPVEFHNWLHQITIPPDIPDPELIRRRNESWTVAEDLFRSSRNVVRWERRARRRAELVREQPGILPPTFAGEDLIGQEVLGKIIGKHFVGLELGLERLHRIPEDDRFVEADAGLHAFASALGKIIVPGALKLTSAVAA